MTDTEDNHSHALPLLAKHGLPATFFLTTGYIARDPEVISRFQMLRRTSFEELEPLTWSQVSDLIGAGMEIGAHTYSHPNLTRIHGNKLRQEIAHSAKFLEANLDSECEVSHILLGSRNGISARSQ